MSTQQKTHWTETDRILIHCYLQELLRITGIRFQPQMKSQGHKVTIKTRHKHFKKLFSEKRTATCQHSTGSLLFVQNSTSTNFQYYS